MRHKCSRTEWHIESRPARTRTRTRTCGQERIARTTGRHEKCKAPNMPKSRRAPSHEPPPSWSARPIVPGHTAYACLPAKRWIDGDIQHEQRRPRGSHCAGMADSASLFPRSSLLFAACPRSGLFPSGPAVPPLPISPISAPSIPNPSPKPWSLGFHYARRRPSASRCLPGGGSPVPAF